MHLSILQNVNPTFRVSNVNETAITILMHIALLLVAQFERSVQVNIFQNSESKRSIYVGFLAKNNSNLLNNKINVIPSMIYCIRNSKFFAKQNRSTEFNTPFRFCRR